MYARGQVVVITLISALLVHGVIGFYSPSHPLSAPYCQKVPSTFQTTCSPLIFVQSSTSSSDSSFVPETTAADELEKIEKLGKVGNMPLILFASV
jgi:hypothetical protein